MEIKEIQEILLKELIKYTTIYVLSNTSAKIANLAYEEIMKIFVELIYKFEGTEYLLDHFDTLSDRLKIFISCFMLPDHKEIALKLLTNISSDKSNEFNESAKNIINNLDENINGYKKQIDQMKLKITN